MSIEIFEFVSKTKQCYNKIARIPSMIPAGTCPVIFSDTHTLSARGERRLNQSATISVSGGDLLLAERSHSRVGTRYHLIDGAIRQR